MDQCLVPHQFIRQICNGPLAMKFLFMLGLTIAQAHPSETARQCSQTDAMKAEAESPSLETWDDVFNSYLRYRQCDDGAISEGYSASTAALLASHWDRMHELKKLVSLHPDFLRFVIHHIDETMTADEGLAIKEHVQSGCPAECIICEEIRRRLHNLGLMTKKPD